MKKFFLILTACMLLFSVPALKAQEIIDPEDPANAAIFDDQMLFNGYVKKYTGTSKEILLAMLADTTLTSFKTAAALRVFNDQFANQIVSNEKTVVERILTKLLSHQNSPFVQVEVMHSLILLDRYRYFKILAPRLIEKLDHYNEAVVAMAYDDLISLISKSTSRVREARVIFNTLRRILFLSRKKLENIREPDEQLRKKLDLLFWSIKVLGTQQIKLLPPEVIRLL